MAMLKSAILLLLIIGIRAQDFSPSFKLKHHDNEELLETLNYIHSQCPNITKIYELGHRSVKGVPLIVIEFSDRPGKHEIRLSSIVLTHVPSSSLMTSLPKTSAPVVLPLSATAGARTLITLKLINDKCVEPAAEPQGSGTVVSTLILHQARSQHTNPNSCKRAAPNMEYKRCSSCIPGLGDLTGYYQPGQLNPGFSELVTAPPSPFSSGLGTSKGGVQLFF
ncbi:CPE [Cordylochernes scorpioides]|uniref:CPE n=1 Tax=Cordylochernes scorpioides TaxID=51811 RepID=A0ABY6L0Q9_9ARAC|nr:CPE [Cordylochernes scorpioides]